MSWNVIELDFGGEETANFGTRHESGTALFQLHTAATISHSEPELAKKPPFITACGSSFGLCVAADNQASIFDQNCQKQHGSFCLETTVELAAWVDELPLLILAERNGTVHFIHALLNKAFLSKPLLSDDESDLNSTYFRQICITKDAQGKHILMLLASPGTLFTFSNLDLVKLDEAIKKGDFAAAKNLQSQICMEQTDLTCVHSDGAMGMTTINIGGQAHIVTCGGGEFVLAFWKTGVKTELRRRVKPTKHIGGMIIKCVSFGKYIFTLDEENKVSMWNTTPLLLSVWAIGVRDFFLAGGETSGDGRPRFQLVMLNTSDKNGSFLKVYDLPSMQLTYSLGVGAVSALLPSPPNQDFIYFIEGRNEDECEGDSVTMLMVRCLTEALPETRFHRLLHKKRFEEAENFAKLFNLNLELVHRSKANALLDLASTWSLEPEEGEERGGEMKTNDLCEDLVTCLDKITDIVFVGGVCINATMATLEDTTRILQYGRARLSKSKGKEEMHQTQQLFSLIVAALHRLATFDRVHGSNNYSPSSWENFLNGDLLDEMVLHLSHAHLAKASVIWNRHREDVLNLMSTELFERLLRAIPRDAPSGDLIPWLRDDIIPFVCRNFPHGKNLLIAWVEERVVSLEVTEKGAWPSNGLELAKLMLNGSQQSLATAWGVNFAQSLSEYQTSGSDCKDALDNLKNLVHCLYELHKLHTKYKCFLTLDQFRMETTVSISFRMLERVAALELVPGAIANCVAPYARDNDLKVDDLLLRYIEDLLSSSVLFASYEASWEAKAIKVIRCIRDLGCRCRAIYVLMQKAPVPWSPDMEQLVQDGLCLDHPLVSQLQERFQLIELRNIFLKYDLRSVTLEDPRVMKIAVWNILSREGDSILEDAMQVLKALKDQLSKTDAYLFRLQYLIKTNQIDRSIELLVSLPAQESVPCLTRLLSWTDIILSDRPDCFPDDESKEQRLLVGQAALRLRDLKLCREQCGDSVGLSLCRQKQQHIQCILHLQMEYDLVIPLDSYCSEAYRLRVLKKFVVEHFREVKSGTRQKENLCSVERKERVLKPGNFLRVQRLGELLGVLSCELQGQLALKAAETGEIARAIEMCRELSDVRCSPGVAHTVYKVCHTIVGQWLDGHDSARSSGDDLVLDVLQLLQRASAFCDQDLLIDCSDLCTRLHSLMTISSRCESGEYGISLQISAAESKKDPYQEYTFENFFKEDSVVLDPQSAIPLAANFVLSCHPQPRPRDAMPYQQARVAGQLVPVTDEAVGENEADVSQSSHMVQVGSATNDLFLALRESSQCELAFQCLMHSLATVLTHLTHNHNKRPVQDQVLSQAIQQDFKKMGVLIHMSKKTMAELSSMLLNKIFSCRNIDSFLALCYLAVLPKKLAKEQVKKLVHSAGQNYKKIMAIAKVGCEMARLDGEHQLLMVYQDLHTNAAWGDRLLKLKISFKDALNNADKHALLLPELIAHPETSLELITDYCRDFQLDEQKALMNYLHLLLLPSDGVPSGDGGVSSRPLDSRFVHLAVDKVQERAGLVKMLLNNIDKIDCYDYERLRLVLRIIHDSNLDVEDQTHSTEVGLKLLDYLDAYTRIKPPTDYEITFQQSQEEEGLMLTAKPLPPLSKTRLPFHPLLRGGQWKILSPELSEDTLGQLLPIAEVLQLSIDQLYVTAIQNMIRACQKKASRPNDKAAGTGLPGERLGQCVKKLDLETLVQVKDLLQKIEHLEMAVATARFIAKELPVSKEKVMALKICEGLALRWKEVSQEGAAECQKACAMYERLVAERKAVSTEEALWRHDLAKPPYTQMIATPAKLIFALYDHDSIVQRVQDSHQDYPDINGATEEIAKINSCNMDKIRLHLTNQWLPQPATSRQDETTMNFSLGSPENDEIPEEEKSLMRLKYVLQPEKSEKMVKFLLNFAFTESSMTGSQVRALRCLFSIVDEPLIEEVSKRSVAELREYLKNLVYLNEFEALSIAMDLPTFTSSHKEGLVRGLWRNHNHEPRSVQLISNLCLEYGVYDTHLWNSILLQLQKFGMLDYLGYVLVQVAGVEELRSVQCLSMVWSVVLSAPFTSVWVPVSEQQAQKCRSVLSLLLRCPVLFDLDLVRLSCQFVRVQMHAEALACLLNMPEKSARDVQVKTLLHNRGEKVLEALTELKASNQPLPGHEQIVAEVKRHLQS